MDSRLSHLLSSLEKTPDDPFLNYAVALELAHSGKEGEALERFEAVYRRFPDYVPLYFHYGKLLAAEGKRDEATKVLTQGLDVSLKAGNTHAHREIQGLIAQIESGEEIF